MSGITISGGFVPASVAAALSGQTVPGNLTVNGQISASFPGSGLSVKSGANCKIGTGTLAAGTVTIADTAVTANSQIFLTDTSNGANLGVLSVGTIIAGTSFVVNSSNIADVGTFGYLIVEKA